MTRSSGSRAKAGLYLDCELRELSAGRVAFKYVPVVSEVDIAWTGRTGLVHEAVLDDFSDLSDFDIYACGSPAMVDATRKAFVCRGARPEKFFADSFDFSRPSGRRASGFLQREKVPR